MCEEDFIGLRLYTGPLFVKTNFVLRNTGKTSGGTNYSSCSTRTTVSNSSNLIHAILSGLSKLSQVSGIPEDRESYRGVGDMHLPARFYEEDDTGVRGGAESGMLSTSTDKKVAIFYIAGRNRLHSSASKWRAVSKGPLLCHFSQFPMEEEVLMPPGSFLRWLAFPGWCVLRTARVARNPDADFVPQDGHD